MKKFLVPIFFVLIVSVLISALAATVVLDQKPETFGYWSNQVVRVDPVAVTKYTGKFSPDCVPKDDGYIYYTESSGEMLPDSRLPLQYRPIVDSLKRTFPGEILVVVGLNEHGDIKVRAHLKGHMAEWLVDEKFSGFSVQEVASKITLASST